MGVVAEPIERRHVAIGHEPDAAPVAAITAIWAAPRDVRLPPKRDGSRPAVTRFDVDLGFVDER
jgi:hypothetical protein